jgi:hypothetical protein
MRLQDRLLTRAQLEPGEQPQVIAVLVQGPLFGGDGAVHGLPIALPVLTDAAGRFP